MSFELVKQLVSGTDKMREDKIIKMKSNLKQSLPNFTTFINSNDTYELTTNTAGENLITLQFTTKFVIEDASEFADNCKYYKLKDKNVEDLITNEDR